ncbi:hypothetical protein ABIE41_004762 [Bosea sp. OAE506]
MQGREVVARRPDAGGELLLEGDDAALEGLERHLPVAEVLPAHPVEIVDADIHRQVAPPVVRHALELDEAALFEASDLVGARAERRLQRRGLEIAGRPVFLREDRQPGDDQVQIAAALGRQLGDEDVVALGCGGGELVQHQTVGGVPLALQQVHAEGDVAGADAAAVMEAGLRPQPEPVGQPVRRNRDALGQQAIERAWLVARARHQAVEAGIHAGRAVALQHEGVERVEGVEALVAAGALDLDGERAALRRLGVHVGKMRKIGGESEFAEGRETMRLDALRDRASSQARQHRAAREESSPFQNPPARHADRHRVASPRRWRGVRIARFHLARPVGRRNIAHHRGGNTVTGASAGPAKKKPGGAPGFKEA